ncbi:DUF3086 domain-containing protein [Picosynechococcus sp. NKBG15041c]|uniref:DUF3086 domain-containing protein n=1 Tax=Picosynechococcus sp. NKBG15041c TaxID=1407650 RepID=UPI0004017106
MSSDPQQDRPKLDLQPAPKEPLNLAPVPEDSDATATPGMVSEQQQQDAAAVDSQGELSDLRAEKDALIAEIAALKAEKETLSTPEMTDFQTQLQQLMATSLQSLEERQARLQASVVQLEKRRDKIREEMRTTFAGTSQDIAVRVQGFKDYLIGSLQDLAIAAEQLDLPRFDQDWEAAPAPVQTPEPTPQKLVPPQFSEQSFTAKTRRIEEMLDQYRMSPDYYGPPWQLRRTFEPIHSERVKKWFFEQGGRGAIRSMGSRLQNILIASASLSVLYNIYGDRLRALILANTPERLGEWRRGLQDCLGISRSDFGPNSGVILFENPDALVQKADRLVEDDRLPLIIIDEAEDNINLSLLQYPLWLAFAPEPQSDSSYFF